MTDATLALIGLAILGLSVGAITMLIGTLVAWILVRTRSRFRIVLDILAFLNAWTANDRRADFNQDGKINTLDVLAFLNQWNGGC